MFDASALGRVNTATLELNQLRENCVCHSPHVPVVTIVTAQAGSTDLRKLVR
ncbi:hypothetical protein Q31a_28020 [Aureliella helgolandensis]|uniref:Uncharacterized protein n=1 Tax=Aureliella helgolandensis TaxID=2527968 RepID=A0A518G7B6_9BACT|nr:hypothetical protein Q31a_28020 [Aureliella helgolandensis]